MTARTFRPAVWPKHYTPKPHPQLVWSTAGGHVARPALGTQAR